MYICDERFIPKNILTLALEYPTTFVGRVITVIASEQNSILDPSAHFARHPLDHTDNVTHPFRLPRRTGGHRRVAQTRPLHPARPPHRDTCSYTIYYAAT